MNGSKLTEKAMQVIEEHGGKVINLIAASKAANADLIACINGRYCEFEIKGKGDTEKPAQAEKLNSAIRAGGVAGFVHSIADLEKLILLAETNQQCDKVKAKIESITL